MADPATAFPVLSTQRLSLVEITGAYLGGLFSLFTNKEVTEFYPVIPLHKEEDAQKIVDMLGQRFRECAAIRWGITLKGSDDLIGVIGYDSFARGHKGTIVYALLPGHRRQGYITEALEEIVRYGFSELRLSRISAEVMPGNTASAQLLEKSGFLDEGILRSWLFWEGKYYDVNMYALLKTGAE